MSVKVSPLINTLSTKGFAGKNGVSTSFLDGDDLSNFALASKASRKIAEDCFANILEKAQQQFGCLTEAEKKKGYRAQYSQFILYRELEQIGKRAWVSGAGFNCEYALILDSRGNLKARHFQEYLNEGNFWQRWRRKLSLYLGFESRALFEKCRCIWQKLEKVREDIHKETENLKKLGCVNIGKEIWPRYKRLWSLYNAANNLNSAFRNHLDHVHGEINKQNSVVKWIVWIARKILFNCIFFRTHKMIALWNKNLDKFYNVAEKILDTWYPIGGFVHNHQKIDVQAAISLPSKYRFPLLKIRMVHNGNALADVGIHITWLGNKYYADLGYLDREHDIEYYKLEKDFFDPLRSCLRFCDIDCSPNALFSQQFITKKIAQIAIEILLRERSSSMSLSTVRTPDGAPGSELNSTTLAAKGFEISKGAEETYLWKSLKDDAGHFRLYNTKEREKENRRWDSVLKNSPIIQVQGQFLPQFKDDEREGTRTWRYGYDSF